MRRQVEESFGLVVAVAPYVGYEVASEVAREAHRDRAGR